MQMHKILWGVTPSRLIQCDAQGIGRNAAWKGAAV